MKASKKFEIVGIVGSVLIMVCVLSILKTKTDILGARYALPNETQEGSVALGTQNTSTSSDTKITELEQILKDAHSVNGELVKLVINDAHLGTVGESVKNGDTVTVHYVGTLQDGTKFDSSYDRGQTFTFTIGKGIVIKGWEEGLIGMKVGGRRILVIPSDMAYGNRQVGNIPPNTPLIFAVELLEIKK
ncbi:MAG TPA: FKBP-type peptidyl-prolyl cis-trans isomerase [Candidatus Paceibacterota bacterium]|nr:FKBP-type peptidyl-prolyl cis-trans isomerase [Candidatus Paceibacterota bacterium]